MKYAWYDEFCKCYWNVRKREWQKFRTIDCWYSSEKEAEEDLFYIYDVENVVLRKLDHNNLAFAA